MAIEVRQSIRGLDADGGFRGAEGNQHQPEFMSQMLDEDRDLVRDLDAVGVSVTSVFDLVKNKLDYSAAIPVLVRWLAKAKSPNVREGIVRALTMPESRNVGAAAALIEHFLGCSDSELAVKWAIGNAILEIGDWSVADRIIEIVNERKHGMSRQMFAVAVGRMKHERSLEALKRLLEDEQVAGHAILGLGELGHVEAKPLLERFLNMKGWVSREARKALVKIDKSSRRSKKKSG
jgi:HEAT repeat protein